MKVNMNVTHSDKWLALLSCIPILTLFYFIIFCIPTRYQSDDASIMLQLEHYIRSGQFYPDDFYHGSKTITFTIFSLPFLFFLPTSMWLYLCTLIIYSIFFMICFRQFCKNNKFDTLPVIIVFSFIFTPFSYFWGFGFWHMAVYGYTSLGFLFLAVLLKKMLIDEDNIGKTFSKSKFTILRESFIYCALFILGLQNGGDIGLSVAPIFFALILTWFLSSGNARAILNFKYIIIYFVVIIISIALNEYIFKRYYLETDYLARIMSFTNITIFKDRFLTFPFDWLKLFDALPVEGKPFTSMSSLFFLSRLMLSLLLIAVPISNLLNYGRIRNNTEKVLIWSWFFVAFLTLTLYIFTNAARTPVHLVPKAFFSFILLLFKLDLFWKTDRRKLVFLVSILILPCWLDGARSVWSTPPTAYRHNIHQRLTNFLLKNELYYGYASFWNAPVITGRSSSRVKVRQICPANLSPFLFLSTAQWYDPRSHHKETFLMLTEHEYASSPRAQILSQVASKTLYYENFYIFVFSFDLAKYLWLGALDENNLSKLVTGRTLVFLATDLPSQTGEVKNQKLVAFNGIHKEGFINYGPYIPLSVGRYNLVLNYASNAPDYEIVGYFEITINLGNTVIKRQEMYGTNGSNSRVSLYFEKSECLDSIYEFRTWWNGLHDFQLEKIQLTPSVAVPCGRRIPRSVYSRE